MKKKYYLLTFLFTIIQVNSFAIGVTVYSKPDTINKLTKIEVLDSLRTADSIKVFKKYKTSKTLKISVLSALAAASGYGSLLYGLDINGYPMLFLGLLCIGLVFSIFRIKKKKPKSYEELKKKQSEPVIKKYSKFNKSWNYAFFIGLLGFSITLISIYLGFSLSLLFLILFLSSLLFFILGFKGKYDSPIQFIRKLILGFLGLLLHWIPIIVILALLSGRGE